MEFLGKFRGEVVDNNDPLRLGRIKTAVPAISEHYLTWALPCLPFNGGTQPDQYTIPPIGCKVWIEFERGDPDYPIWVGIFF